MASSCSRFTSRTSLPSLRSVFKSRVRANPPAAAKPATSSRFPLPSKPSPSPIRRFSLSRSPSELGCVQSLLPLHSAVAAARMTSCLTAASRSCRALSQGT